MASLTKVINRSCKRIATRLAHLFCYTLPRNQAAAWSVKTY